MTCYLGDAFSLRMLEKNAMVTVNAATIEEIGQSDFISVVKNQDLADVLSGLLDRNVECGTKNIRLHKQDMFYIAQLMGEESPEEAWISLKKVRIL